MGLERAAGASGLMRAGRSSIFGERAGVAGFRGPAWVGWSYEPWGVDLPTSDDTALIVRGVLRLGRRLRAERPESQVSLSALGMLSTLHRNGPMPAARLAKAERLQPQSLSRLIAQLDRGGLIKRRPGREDRRMLILEITAAGRRVLSRDMAARRAWLEEAMGKVLLPGERELLAHAAVAMLRLADEGVPARDVAEESAAEGEVGE